MIELRFTDPKTGKLFISGKKILALAPHPDDFDTTAVTLRHLHKDNVIKLCVLTSGHSGIHQSFFAENPDADMMTVRREEQLASTRLFGLPDDAVEFHVLDHESHHMPDDDNTYSVINVALLRHKPDIVLLPHGNDPNPDHNITYKLFRKSAKDNSLKLSAWLFFDPKTLGMSANMYTLFGKEEAEWKASLLVCHRTQHQRNMIQRGYGFDRRILDLNKALSEKSGFGAEYAEAFEIEEY